MELEGQSGSMSIKCEFDFASVALGLVRFICFIGRLSEVTLLGGERRSVYDML